MIRIKVLIHFSKFQEKYILLIIVLRSADQSRALGIESRISWGEMVLAGMRMREAAKKFNPAMTVPARNTDW